MELLGFEYLMLEVKRRGEFLLERLTGIFSLGLDMDLWVFAAAAAVGYLANYWQNISKQCATVLRRPADSKFANPEPLDHPSSRLTQNKLLGEMFCADRRNFLGRRFTDMNCLDVVSAMDLASTYEFGNEKLQDMETYQYGNVLSISSPPWEWVNESLEEDERENWRSSPSMMIGSLQTKISCGRCIKPLNSVQSCLAQLYKKNDMENFISRSSPLSTPTKRPNFVDENIQNRDFFAKLMGLNHNKHVYGVPQLPKIWSSETPIAFCFGIFVGIVSSLVSNKKEVDKLREVLKQTEDLVQDLEEELETRDSLTVKELSGEYCESRDTCGNSFPEKTLNAFSSKQNMDQLPEFECCKLCAQKAEESSDSMIEIEAELEAELERLELGANPCSNEARFSDLIELDQEFLDDFVEGESTVDIQSNQRFPPAKPNRDANYSTTRTGNYGVSPQELSLRLHEVIQLRLESRVNELEIALLNSERKAFVEARSKNLRRASSDTSKSSSSTKESSISNKEFNSTTCPPKMDLYGGAYKEFTKMDDSDEERLSLDIRITNKQSCDELNHSVTYRSEEVSNFHGQNNVGYGGDENGDDNDETEELIKKIVEKARKGSPVVLKAQRWLFSLDEEEISSSGLHFGHFICLFSALSLYLY